MVAKRILLRKVKHKTNTLTIQKQQRPRSAGSGAENDLTFLKLPWTLHLNFVAGTFLVALLRKKKPKAN